MAEVKISDVEALVEVDIRVKKETYYFVTEDCIKSLIEKNILTNIFVLLASGLWGAYVSVFVIIKSSTDLPNSTSSELDIYKYVFFIGAIVFSVLSVLLFFLSYRGFSNIKRSSYQSLKRRIKSTSPKIISKSGDRLNCSQ